MDIKTAITNMPDAERKSFLIAIGKTLVQYYSDRVKQLENIQAKKKLEAVDQDNLQTLRDQINSLY